MGVDLQTYRCRIGSFKFSGGVDVVTLYIYINFSGSFRTIGCLLFIGLLLLIAGIESNPGPRARDEATHKLHTTKILVTNLPQGVGKDDIEQYFSEIVHAVGKVIDIEVNSRDSSALIEFDSHEGADCVLNKTHYEFNDHKVKVELYCVKPEDIHANASTDLESESRAADKILYQRQKETQSNFDEILDLLGLKEMFPSKLTVENLAVVRTDVSSDKPVTLKELPWILLQGIVFVNSNIRDSLLSSLSSESTQDSIASSNFDDLFDDDGHDNQGVSSFDIFTVVLQCCDPMLKQLLYQKLYLCKKALPFINVQLSMHDCKPMFSIWPLRSLQVESVLNCHGDKLKETEIGVLNLPTKLVTFLRFGRPRFSKSSLLNLMLSDYNANTFFSKECMYGSAERKLTQGLVEISWLPKVGNKKDKFDDAITFLNCRGNFEEYSEKTIMQALASISDIVVLVVDLALVYNKATKLANLLLNFRQSILIIANPLNKCDKEVIKQFQNTATETIILKTFNGENEKSVVDMAFTVHKLLSTKIKDEQVNTLIDRIQILSETTEIIADEDDKICTTCKSLAETLIEQMKSTGPGIRRELITPIQSKIAPEIGRRIKLRHRLQNDSETQRLASEIVQQRRQVLLNISPSVKQFVRNLIELESSSVCQTFIAWLRIFLSDKNAHDLSTFIQENTLNKQKLEKMRNDVNSCDRKVQDLEQRIKTVNIQIDDLSFNVEHLFREIGYIYDTAIVLNIDMTEKGLPPVTDVANVISDFIIRGNSFELIDGNSFLLPAKWIDILFRSVSNKIEHNNVLALSVLGIQSSGKSTFLNVMFGSQFRASVGRCTKGINVQLLRVKQNKVPTTKQPFNFVLVIDTEGLRAQELWDQTLDHDNELATVIAGLGDITILNIKGENTSEMNDILHVVVHAFLRLKLANENLDIHKRCYFIHQNVSSILASGKMRRGLETLKHALDKATQESAEIEKMFNVKYFDEVIEFDINTHVWYMPNLWQGTPPVEFVNQGYSDGVLAVKCNIIQNAIEMKHKSYKSLNDTAVHAMDLWEGVLSEDFVFSFRNSLEIKHYVNLSTVFYEQRRKLEHSMNESCISLSDKMLFQCETVEFLDKTVNDLKAEVGNYMNKEEETLKRTMETFIDNAESREITEKWRESTYLKIETFCNDLLCHLKQEIQKLYCKRKMHLLTLNKKLEKEFYEMSMQVAKELKGKNQNDLDIENKFVELWSSVFTDEKTSHEPSNIRSYFHERLLEKHSTHRTFVSQQLKHYDDIMSEHKAFKSLRGTLKNIVLKDGVISEPKGNFSFWRKQNNPFELAREEVEVLFTDIDVLIDNLCHEKIEITRAQVHKFIDDTGLLVKKFQDETKTKIEGNIKFIIKLVVHISAHANNCFVEHNTRCLEDMVAILDDYKTKQLKIFKSYVDDRQVEEQAAIEFCSVIERRVTDKICLIIPGKIKTALYDVIPMEKYYLIPELLKNLVKENQFELFRQYCENPKKFAEDWINEKAERHLFGENKNIYKGIVFDALNSYFSEIEDAILLSVKESSKETTSIDKWIHIFVSKEQNCNFTPESLHIVKDILQNKVDITGFKDQILEKLEESKHILQQNFDNEVSGVKDIIENIKETMWGCNEICPFCGEPCALDKGHTDSKHVVIQHKPKGIRGFHKLESKNVSIKPCNVDVADPRKYYNCKAIKYKCKTMNAKKECKKGEHRFYDYKVLYPDWEIRPTKDMEACSKFWLWFMANYKTDIAKVFGVNLETIPTAWSDITKNEAIDSLGEVYIDRYKQYLTNVSIENAFLKTHLINPVHFGFI